MGAISTIGTKLGYKLTAVATEYVNAPYLQEVPELGAAPEQIDVTVLTDTIRKNVPGVQDLGDLAFTFIYDKDTFQALKALTGVIFWQVILPDGVKFEFSAIPSIAMGSAAVNAALSYTLSMSIQSEMAVVFA